MRNLTLVIDKSDDRVVQSTLLGEVTVRHTDTLRFPGGMLGFPECREFALLRGERESLYWLQSLEYPALTFLLADPFTVDATYSFDVQPWHVRDLGAFEMSDLGLLAVVTLPGVHGEMATVNLQAPIVINFRTRSAKQLVTGDEHFPVRHPVDLSRFVA